MPIHHEVGIPEKINDEGVIEKVKIFILGILAQKGIEEQAKNKTCAQATKLYTSLFTRKVV